MLTLGEVVRMPQLRLQWAGHPSHEDRRIRWAHVVEIDDPSPWLLGGELLLTTGLRVFRHRTASHEFCARVARAQIGALAISVGVRLPHPEVPDHLVAAAAEWDIPLLVVPEPVPLQSVIQAVSDRLHDEQTTPLRKALEGQQLLAAAAAGPNGIAGIIDSLHRTAGYRCAVVNHRGQVVAELPQAAESLAGTMHAQVRLGLLGGMISAQSSVDEHSARMALPIGTGSRMRGVLLTHRVGVPTISDRAQVTMALSMLSVLMELRHVAERPARQRRSAAMRALLADDIAERELIGRMDCARITASKVQVITAPAATRKQAALLVADVLPTCADVLVRHAQDTDGEVVLVLCDPTGAVEDAVRSTISTAELGPVGIGPVVPPSAAASSLRQAQRAAEQARRRGEPMAHATGPSSFQALTATGNRLEQEAFARAVLRPLLDHDQQAPRAALLPTLRAFIDSTGNLDATAGRAKIHRHTVRARLARICELTGRDLTHAPDLFDLWLALELTDLPPRPDP